MVTTIHVQGMSANEQFTKYCSKFNSKKYGKLVKVRKKLERFNLDFKHHKNTAIHRHTRIDVSIGAWTRKPNHCNPVALPGSSSSVEA